MHRSLKQQAFNCEPLADLARQFLFAPPAKRAEHVRRTERLHDEIGEQRNYPLDFLVYRITGYRRDRGDSVLLVGEAILPDLRLIIDHLSRSVDLPIGEDEPAETAEQLAQRLNVSTKTISRWRKLGLRWRWAVPAVGGRKQIVFTRSAVEHFTARHAERIDKASRFSQIEPEDRQRIVARARRIAQAREVSLNQVATFLARKTGRAVETIRLILEKHDRQHPDDPIFADRTGPLTVKQKRIIERAHRLGVPRSKLTRRFGRTRSTINRAINERRAMALRRVPLAYVALPIFEREDADAVILRPQRVSATLDDPDGPDGAWSTVPVDDLPEPLQKLYRQPVIEPARQRSLFIRYNYLKHKAARIRDSLDRYEPRVAEMDQFDACLRRALRLRDTLVRANLPGVLSVARRHLVGAESSSPQRLIDLLEIGNTVLIEAVDTFNAARSGRFDSYLTNKLLQRFASAAPPQARRRLAGEDARQRILDLAASLGVTLTEEMQPRPKNI